MLDGLKKEWENMSPGSRKVFVWGSSALGLLGTSAIAWLWLSGPPAVDANTAKANQAVAGAIKNMQDEPSFRTSGIIPNSSRNQGLEDMSAELERTRKENKEFKEQVLAMMAARNGGGNAGSTLPANPHAVPDSLVRQTLSAQLPPANGAASASPKNGSDALPAIPAVSFDGKTDKKPTAKTPAPKAEDGAPQSPAIARNARESLVIERESNSTLVMPDKPIKVIPTSSGIDAVMLTGVNAGVSTGRTTAGTAVSATSVGSPFVTRVKGDSILPNGWKLDDLGDCFISGTAIGILTTERANAIADTLSCIHPKNGIVFEAKIKAYGVDNDGIQGIIGKVVSKQGSALGMAFLGGVVGGFGTAVAPIPVIGGLTGVVSTPSASTLARSSLGSGVNNASNALSQFYIKYAETLFPVIEIAPGTRITWIVREPIEINLIRSKQ